MKKDKIYTKGTEDHDASTTAPKTTPPVNKVVNYIKYMGISSPALSTDGGVSGAVALALLSSVP